MKVNDPRPPEKREDGAPPADPQKPEKKKEDHSYLGNLGLFSQIGITMAVCIFIGFFIGRGLDRWLGTAPWLMFLFTLLGVAAAFKTMFDAAKGK